MLEVALPAASILRYGDFGAGRTEASRVREVRPLLAKETVLQNEFSIGMEALEAFLAGARAAGIDVDSLCCRAGLPVAFRSDPKARLSVSQWGRVLHGIMVAMDDEALGLLGRQTPVGTFLMVCRALIHCRTVGEAMTRYIEFYNLLRIGILYRIFERKNSVSLELKLINPKSVKYPVVAEFTLVAFHRLFCWLTSEFIDLDYVWIATDVQQLKAEYRDAFFNAPIFFDKPVHSISFSESFMHLPITRTERELESFLARFNSALFLPMPHECHLSRTLRTFIMSEQQRNGTMPELQDVADHLEMQPSALRRHLKDLGLSYQALKSRVRRDIAFYHLSHTDDSIEQIAEFVGFSETSAFTRAFRDWTDMTPLAFRRAISN